LLLMVPLVLAASFESGFINYYPTLRPGQVARLEHIPAWAAYLLYNTVYASDFVWEELIFRGFLIIGMAGVLGRGAVLPMSVIYCFRHFAKPPGEAISSIFGGYILGVFALRSRSVMGGVMVHVGVALLMELAALLQHTWNTP
ncbi:MAG: CPBP family intramembrane metalloprotease, partial [Bacteroidetes bacterium]